MRTAVDGRAVCRIRVAFAIRPAALVLHDF
jgi:hypothetical protein